MAKTRNRKKLKMDKETDNVPNLQMLVVKNIFNLIRNKLSPNDIYNNIKIIQNIPGVLPSFKIAVIKLYISSFNFNFKKILHLIFNLVIRCCENDPFLFNVLKYLLKAFDPDISKRLVNYQGIGYDFKRVWPNGEFSIENRNNFTLLHIIVGYNNNCVYKFDITKLLLDFGANPNKKDANGNTPLYLEENSWVPWNHTGPRGDPRVIMLLRNYMGLEVMSDLHERVKVFMPNNSKNRQINLEDLSPPKKRVKNLK